MNKQEYRAFLDLLMCSDPYPCAGQDYLLDLAQRTAVEYGYSDWIEAYHKVESE